MYSTVNSGSTECSRSAEPNICFTRSARLQCNQSVSATPTHHNYHTFNRTVNLLVFFSLFYNENFLSRRPILSRSNCSGYNIIPPGTVFKNLVLSQSQTDVGNVHVGNVHVSRNKKKPQFP